MDITLSQIELKDFLKESEFFLDVVSLRYILPKRCRLYQYLFGRLILVSIITVIDNYTELIIKDS